MCWLSLYISPTSHILHQFSFDLKLSAWVDNHMIVCRRLKVKVLCYVLVSCYDCVLRGTVAVYSASLVASLVLWRIQWFVSELFFAKMAMSVGLAQYRLNVAILVNLFSVLSYEKLFLIILAFFWLFYLSKWPTTVAWNLSGWALLSTPLTSQVSEEVYFSVTRYLVTFISWSLTNRRDQIHILSH